MTFDPTGTVLYSDLTSVTTGGRPKGRMPAFFALAGHNGGVYAENLTAGMSLSRALQAANLNYTVHRAQTTAVYTTDEPVLTPTGVTPAGTTYTATDPLRSSLMGVWPDGATRVFGYAHGRYQIVQPAEAAEMGQAVLGLSDSHRLVAAGGYGNPVGAKMYLAFHVGQVTVGGVDRHDLFFHLLNSFDARGGFSFTFAPIRLECTNQTSMHFGQHSMRQTLVHSGNMQAKISAAGEALAQTFTWAGMFKDAAEQMLAARMPERELREFAKVIYPTPAGIKSEKGEQAWTARRAQFVATALHGAANTFGRGTRYAAYNALTFQLDHGQWEQPSSPQAERRRPTALWTRLMDGGEEEQRKVAAAKLLLADLN